MKAFRCDRCGKFFMHEDLESQHRDDQNVYYIVDSLYGPASDNIYDLCVDCYNELKAWMEAKKNEHI